MYCFTKNLYTKSPIVHRWCRYSSDRGGIIDRAGSGERNIAVEEGEFRVLQVRPPKDDREQFLAQRRRREQPKIQNAPRWKKMPVDQDWPSVWPAAQTFKASAVPLPVRQGFTKIDSGIPPPDRFGNLELMKIPNFLHLAPQAVKRHCAALKKFCTPWPRGLETENDCDSHFPLTSVTCDYVHAGSSIRDQRSRIVIIQVKISDLNLDKHARDKMLRLVGNRYDEKTGLLTIVTDQCPIKKQNYDYAIYLLTVLNRESRKVEPWESEKEWGDLMEYTWENSASQASVVDILKTIKGCDEAEARANPKLGKYSEVITQLHNIGETEEAVLAYKESVKELFELKGTN